MLKLSGKPVTPLYLKTSMIQRISKLVELHTLRERVNEEHRKFRFQVKTAPISTGSFAAPEVCLADQPEVFLSGLAVSGHRAVWSASGLPSPMTDPARDQAVFRQARTLGTSTMWCRRSGRSDLQVR